MKNKEGKRGLIISLLTKVRKEIRVIEVELYGIKMLEIKSRRGTEGFCETERTAKIIANSMRQELARTMVKREPKERKLKEKVTNI